MEQSVAQESVEALADSGRIPHAVLIEGGEAVGRVEAATMLAAAALCEGKGKKPCRVCGACKKVFSGLSPDVSLIKTESDKKTLSVALIRKIGKDAFILPNESKGKVYIIAEGEALQDYAQNALLKLLEEPPENVFFIICAPDACIFLPTLLSRVTRLSLKESRSLQGDDFKEAMELSLAITNALLQKDGFALLEATSVLYKSDKKYALLKSALQLFEHALRDALVINAGKPELVRSFPAESARLAKEFEREQLLEMQRAAEEISGCTERSANKNLTATRLAGLLSAAAGLQGREAKGHGLHGRGLKSH